jgi:hypothetical protein
MNENNNTQTVDSPNAPKVENKGWWSAPAGHYVGGLLENLRGIADASLKAVANGASAGYESAKSAWASTTTAAASGQKTVGEYCSAAYSACCQAANRAGVALTAAYAVTTSRLTYAVVECDKFVRGVAFESWHMLHAAMVVGGVVMIPTIALAFFPSDALAAVVGIGLGIYAGMLLSVVLSIGFALIVSTLIVAGVLVYSAFEALVDACVAAAGVERTASPAFAA